MLLDIRFWGQSGHASALRSWWMSALGHKRTLKRFQSMSALPQKRTWFGTIVMSALSSGHCGTPASMGYVMTVRNSSRPIARVFRATAAPGCRDELLQRFHSSSAALVSSKVGCLKYRILEPVDALAPEVVFESIWRDLDAVKVAFGDAWRQSHLPEGYSALMTAYSVHHFLVSESSTTK